MTHETKTTTTTETVDELPEDVKVLTDDEAAVLPPNDAPADEEQAEPAEEED